MAFGWSDSDKFVLVSLVGSRAWVFTTSAMFRGLRHDVGRAVWAGPTVMVDVIKVQA